LVHDSSQRSGHPRAPLVGVRVIIDQLLKAGTAVGANLEEAKAGSSRKEFIRYVEISLREARESLYWLRICEALKLGPGIAFVNFAARPISSSES
jgi:hypothetical protein